MSDIESRIKSVTERYKKSHIDAPGQKDLFTGDVRKSPNTQSKLKWITLHDVHGNGTTHVQISESGDIKSGPSSLMGRNLSNMKGKTQSEPPSRDPYLEYTSEGRPVGSTVRNVDDLHVDSDRFQYKVVGIDKSTGTTTELKEAKIFNPDFGGQILIWRDMEDGKDWVINGHHRVSVAKRSPRGTGIGEYKGQIPVRYINAKNAKEARALGALANIAEKNGTATDAAKFMRDMNVGLEEFEKRGISPNGSIAQAALELKKLSPSIFQKLTNGQLTEQRAQTIAKHLPDEDMQDQFFGWLQKHEKESDPFSERKVMEMAKSTARMKPKESSGPDLFKDWFKDFPIEERASISEHVGRTLSGEAKSLRDASSTKRAGMIEAEGENKIDTDANRVRAKRAAVVEDEFNLRSNAGGHPIAKALDDFAERMAKEHAKKRPGILKEALTTIRKLLEESGSDGEREGSSVRRVQENDRGGRDRQQGVRDPAGPITKMSRLERAEANLRYCRERHAEKAPFQGWFNR